MNQNMCLDKTVMFVAEYNSSTASFGLTVPLLEKPLLIMKLLGKSKSSKKMII